MNIEQTDKLESLFTMQATLNDHTFAKHRIDAQSYEQLNMAILYTEGKDEEDKGANSLTNEWLRKYLEAEMDESRELKDELLWKWWSKDKLNMQNIRVEIVDKLHFWISLALTAGMDADEVYRIYMIKNQVNLDRQNNGYSKENKTETDNEAIV